MPLVNYDDSDEEINNNGLLNAAPAARVNVSYCYLLFRVGGNTKIALKSTSLIPLGTDQVSYGRPIGPKNPYENVSSFKKNIITGHAQEEAFDDATFTIQHRTFQMLGYAKDDKNGEIIGDRKRAAQYNNQDISQIRSTKEQQMEIRVKRQKKGDTSVLDGPNAYKGPWAKYTQDEDEESEEAEYEGEEAYEEEEEEEEEEEKELAKTTTKPKQIEDQEESEFVGSQEFDYLGRTYMHVPRDLDINLFKEPGEQECFIPKRKVHSWIGHSGGVTALRFFPKFGHILLSSGNDCKIKIWDVYHDREQLRIISGHDKSVKDIDFNPTGTKFLSTSYDKMIKLWDTETGKCISRFTTGRTANCVKFNPEIDEAFVAGMSNNKIIQFDIRTKEIAQEYDHHLGPVNTITFVDNNQRFMTTSDDKSIRVWEWQINVPIKFIADPYQHSMPSVRLHPGGKYVACQSMDNTILVFGATDRFRQNRKKVFMGSTNAGYSIGIDFSPDGKYLMSGDSSGNCIFWDWKTCQLKSKFKAHNNGPLLCIASHPQETSKVATGGLESVINYWD